MVAALEALNLFRFFHAGGEEALVLRGASCSLGAGELVAVLGPSGSGKSTLLACLAGLDTPDGGMVEVAGHAMSRRPEPERARLRARHIGILLQSGNLAAHLSVERNLELAQHWAGAFTRGERRARRRQLLETLGLSHRSAALPNQLSGGEAARAGLAVAMVNDPEILLADEPTAEIDEGAQADVLRLLQGRAAAGAAVLVATHNPLVAAAADRRLTLIEGRLEQQ